MRVLVVDDSETMRWGLRALVDSQPDLECCGTAEGGAEGIALARETRPDVVLMDLVMDDVDGVAACRRILRDRPQTRVLILTANPEHVAQEAALRAGAAGFVTKQVGPEPLLAAIRGAGQSTVEPA